MTRFNWTPERLAILRRLYLEEKRGPVEIARMIGDGCNEVTISSAVRIHGMKRPRTASIGFNWTADAEATLRRLYQDPNVTCAHIAQRIGNGCTDRAVVRKAAALKLSSPRRHKPGPRNWSQALRIERVPEAKRRFVGWFINAGWPPREVVRLFDLSPEQVAA